MQIYLGLAALLLAGCERTELIELQSSANVRTSASDEQLSDRMTSLEGQLRTHVSSGQNGEGFYANFDVGSCHYAVQRFRDAHLQVDAYWYSERTPAQCANAPALKRLKAVLATQPPMSGFGLKRNDRFF
ncbi:hypothetical protein [Sphingomonas sp. Leaf33]|uniref:hypothetical protein n=1 Tax=Sphingomonas sp. Leaf33 TaxID=1736215 RepID=UPI0012E2AC7F|nr:hypothetical protein [Sphingomonas sp. Leaf33]